MLSFTWARLRSVCSMLKKGRQAQRQITNTVFQVTSEATVSERLGHATVAFTLDTYTHVVPGLQEVAAKAFDESLNNVSIY